MLIRQLEYLVALASERHFARAAERCGVSQPTLSAALRQLEGDLGTAIVERGTRFRGFTADGEVVLSWARRMLADEVGMRQELDASRGTLKGRLRLGVIPSTNAVVPYLSASFASEHPEVSKAVGLLSPTARHCRRSSRPSGGTSSASSNTPAQ